MLDNNTLMYYHSLVYKIYIYFQLKEYILNGNFHNNELTNFYTFSIIWDNLR